MSVGHCHLCARRLVDVLGRPVVPVDRTLDGHRIRLHGSCSKLFDAGKPYIEKPPKRAIG